MSASWTVFYGAQYPAHLYLCLRFAACLTTGLAQNSRPCGSLLLSRKALSSSAPCRFIPAHSSKYPSFQKVTQLAPENYAGYVNLGGTYNDVGRLLEAIEPLKKSISLRPSYAGYTNLGTSYLGLHKLKEAAYAYQQAVKLDPKQYVTVGNLGSAQKYSGAKDEARISYTNLRGSSWPARN